MVEIARHDALCLEIMPRMCSRPVESDAHFAAHDGEQGRRSRGFSDIFSICKRSGRHVCGAAVMNMIARRRRSHTGRALRPRCAVVT
jgi:hypothetical protein